VHIPNVCLQGCWLAMTVHHDFAQCMHTPVRVRGSSAWVASSQGVWKQGREHGSLHKDMQSSRDNARGNRLSPGEIWTILADPSQTQIVSKTADATHCYHTITPGLDVCTQCGDVVGDAGIGCGQPEGSMPQSKRPRCVQIPRLGLEPCSHGGPCAKPYLTAL
jgi:hypothetical protein